MHRPSYQPKPTHGITAAQLTSAVLLAETCPERHQKQGKAWSPALTPTATKLPLYSLQASHEKHIPHFCYVILNAAYTPGLQSFMFSTERE